MSLIFSGQIQDPSVIVASVVSCTLREDSCVVFSIKYSVHTPLGWKKTCENCHWTSSRQYLRSHFCGSMRRAPDMTTDWPTRFSGRTLSPTSSKHGLNASEEKRLFWKKNTFELRCSSQCSLLSRLNRISIRVNVKASKAFSNMPFRHFILWVNNQTFNSDIHNMLPIKTLTWFYRYTKKSCISNVSFLLLS